jgi:hypothetical protein
MQVRFYRTVVPKCRTMKRDLKPHTFHIPVMGLGYTIDTPIKVAPFGIDSAISIVEDNIVEQVRMYYAHKFNRPAEPIPQTAFDHRAERIRQYLNLVDSIVKIKTEKLRNQPFHSGNEIDKYFNLLPDNSPNKIFYLRLPSMKPAERAEAEQLLRYRVRSGSIDVNIMTKLDNPKRDKTGQELEPEMSDALAALRGFATSTLESSMIFSAGMNPRLFAYTATFPDFFPTDTGFLKKKIILKVSDYRSALIQGKLLAKRGLWISEFRIESGLNCGGHAFATDGLLLGPILEEFKEKREELQDILLQTCNQALAQEGKPVFEKRPTLRITAQGGVGTAMEHEFLLNYYHLDSVGWGSPFLMVPEVTNVDEETLTNLVDAKPEDYYLSHASPLGVPFNNFRKSSSEKQRLDRIKNGKPGSPCLKKFLQFNTEFTKTPICTASTKYQYLKLSQLKKAGLSSEAFEARKEEVLEKDCLCEGLSSSVRLTNNIQEPNQIDAVAICPGPNLAFFSGVFSLETMIGHIYGRVNILNNIPRPNLFINELNLYVKYMEEEMRSGILDDRKSIYWNKFRNNLIDCISYYKDLASRKSGALGQMVDGMVAELSRIETSLIEGLNPGLSQENYLTPTRKEESRTLLVH